MTETGPEQVSHSERLAICQEIANRLQDVYGDQIKAIGIYGSVSRGTDGPYSDIEMFCVIRESPGPIEFSYEWSAGPWKAEVDICSEDILLIKAATVEGRWPLTHGPYFAVLSIHDPENFFPTLKVAADSPKKEDFSRAITEVLVGEMYEFAGKLRNVSFRGPQAYLPYLAVQFVQYGAMLIGLHNRKTFSTGAEVVPEALHMPDRPEGFDNVAKLVMAGDLSDPTNIVSACEQLWTGLTKWAVEHDYAIVSERIPF